MKYTLLLSVLLVIGANSFAQTDTLFQKLYVFAFPEDSYLTVDQHGNIKISGDTMGVIKEMVKNLLSLDSTIRSKNRVISAAVNVTNCFPDYFRPKAKWKTYETLLKKEGYGIYKITQKNKPCCK